MFGIGPVEFIILLVIAVVVFGPERLPEAAKKASTMIRQLRRLANNARNDLSDELGPEFQNLDLNDLRDPRRAVQKYVLDGVDEDDVRIDKDLDIRKDVDLRKDLDELDDEDSDRPARRRSGRLNGTRTGSGAGSTGSGGEQPGSAQPSAGTASEQGDAPGDTQDDIEDAGDERATLTLTQNERPPFDPDAT